MDSFKIEYLRRGCCTMFLLACRQPNLEMLGESAINQPTLRIGLAYKPEGRHPYILGGLIFLEDV